MRVVEPRLAQKAAPEIAQDLRVVRSKRERAAQGRFGLRGACAVLEKIGQIEVGRHEVGSAGDGIAIGRLGLLLTAGEAKRCAEIGQYLRAGRKIGGGPKQLDGALRIA